MDTLETQTADKASEQEPRHLGDTWGLGVGWGGRVAGHKDPTWVRIGLQCWGRAPRWVAVRPNTPKHPSIRPSY